MMQAVQPYISLMRLNRPVGIFLLLWPTLIALWLASNGQPDLRATSIFVLGVIIMRSAGCVINDYADRDFDLYVERTKNRPLTSKQISTKSALTLFFVLLMAALGLVLQLNINTILLAFVAAGLAIIYPFSKRVTNYPQLFLGLAFAWSIPMVYMQVQGSLGMETWLLFIATVAWVIAYDTQYAMADKDDDVKLGIKSTAIAFSNYDRLIIAGLQLLCLLIFAYIGQQRHGAWPYYLALIVASGLILYQQWLIKDRRPDKCFAAFLNNNWIGLVLFLSVIFC